MVPRWVGGNVTYKNSGLDLLFMLVYSTLSRWFIQYQSKLNLQDVVSGADRLGCKLLFVLTDKKPVSYSKVESVI